MVASTLEMSGIEKASVLLMSLESGASSEVLKRLTPQQRELLGAQIVKMRHVRSVTQQRVLEEVKRTIRAGTLADNGEDNTHAQDAPLKWLEDLDPVELVDHLAGEGPHNTALMIAHFTPDKAAAVLSHLDESTRNKVAHRLAAMGPMSAEAVQAVDKVMRQRVLARASDGERRSAPTDTLLKVLNGAVLMVIS